MTQLDEPLSITAQENIKLKAIRNQNLLEIKTVGRMQWQRIQNYGQRNYSELATQRYQKTLGDTMHARYLTCQKQEANRLILQGVPT